MLSPCQCPRHTSPYLPRPMHSISVTCLASVRCTSRGNPLPEPDVTECWRYSRNVLSPALVARSSSSLTKYDSGSCLIRVAANLLRWLRRIKYTATAPIRVIIITGPNMATAILLMLLLLAVMTITSLPSLSIGSNFGNSPSLQKSLAQHSTLNNLPVLRFEGPLSLLSEFCDVQINCIWSWDVVQPRETFSWPSASRVRDFQHWKGNYKFKECLIFNLRRV